MLRESSLVEGDGLAFPPRGALALPVGRPLGEELHPALRCCGTLCCPARLHGQQHHPHHPISPLWSQSIELLLLTKRARSYLRDGRANTRKHSLQIARDVTSNVKKELSSVGHTGFLHGCSWVERKVCATRAHPSAPHRVGSTGAGISWIAAWQPRELSRGCRPAAAVPASALLGEAGSRAAHRGTHRRCGVKNARFSLWGAGGRT